MIFSKRTRSLSLKTFRWLFGFYLFSLLGLGAAFRWYLHQHIDLTSPLAQDLFPHLDQLMVYTFWWVVFAALLFYFLSLIHI